MQIGSAQNGSVGLLFSVPKSMASIFAHYDPRDANKDGTVSFEEDYFYTLDHPEVEALKRLRTPVSAKTQVDKNSSPKNLYTAQEALNTTGNATGSLLNVSV